MHQDIDRIVIVDQRINSVPASILQFVFMTYAGLHLRILLHPFPECKQTVHPFGMALDKMSPAFGRSGIEQSSVRQDQTHTADRMIGIIGNTIT